MKLLINGGAIKQLSPIFAIYPKYRAYVGFLKTPFCGNAFGVMQSFRLSIAMDNAAYNGFCPKAYLSVVNEIREKQVGIDWVSVPDTVADADKTHQSFMEWQPRLSDLPLAYVGQDGCEDMDIPFNAFEAFFIGGSTEWKLSAAAISVITEAKRHGKIVHMGRVNSDKRLRYAHTLGVDSVDGTGYCRFSIERFLPALNYLDGLHRQLEIQ